MAAAAPRHAAGLLLAAVALCALASCAVAQQDPYNSTGWNVGGFTIVSNVTGHLALSRDACDIARAINPVDYTANLNAIAHIYLNGRNSVRPDGRLRRALSSWTAGAHATGHVYFANGTALYNDTNWIGSFMDAALDPTSGLTAPQRAAIAITTTRLQLPLSYMLAELYSIEADINPNGTTDTLAGPPHALDEGYAVYHGNVSDCAPFAYADMSAGAFGTLTDDCSGSRASSIIVAAFNSAQAATISGDRAQYAMATNTIIASVQVALVQNVLQLAHIVEVDWDAWRHAEEEANDANDAFLENPDAEHHQAAVEAGARLARATAELQYSKAEAYSVYRVLAPFVHYHSPYAARALDTYMSLDAPVSSTYGRAVRYTLQQLYPSMGITPAQVGTLGARSNCTATPVASDSSNSTR